MGFFFVGNHLCLDFVNTEKMQQGERVDLLGGFDDLLAWLVEVGTLPEADAAQWRGSPDAAATLERARGLRGALREMAQRLVDGQPVPAASLEAINGVLEASPGYRRVVAAPEGFARRFQPAGDEPIQLLAPIAEAAAELLCTGDLSLIRRCENPRCILFFYDTSKNRARRWCSMSGCGNRMKVAAHYQRKRSG